MVKFHGCFCEVAIDIAEHCGLGVMLYIKIHGMGIHFKFPILCIRLKKNSPMELNQEGLTS